MHHIIMMLLSLVRETGQMMSNIVLTNFSGTKHPTVECSRSAAAYRVVCSMRFRPSSPGLPLSPPRPALSSSLRLLPHPPGAFACWLCQRVGWHLVSEFCLLELAVGTRRR